MNEKAMVEVAEAAAVVGEEEVALEETQQELD